MYLLSQLIIKLNEKSQSTSLNINLVKLYVTTFIIFATESEKKRRSVLEQRGRKDSER